MIPKAPEHAESWLGLASQLAAQPVAALIAICLLLTAAALWLAWRMYRQHSVCSAKLGQLDSLVSLLWGVLCTDPEYGADMPSKDDVISGRITPDEWLRRRSQLLHQRRAAQLAGQPT